MLKLVISNDKTNGCGYERKVLKCELYCELNRLTFGSLNVFVDGTTIRTTQH